MQTLSQEPIIVSIRCTAYNHEKYIRDCLEGFIMQKTNFRFEAIVHDDASTDRTADIIREYATKYPDIIKPIYETENQYSKKDGTLTQILDKACTGKYIAMCEGDDYWIDPLKLQKQVDFLESHPNCSAVTTNKKILAKDLSLSDSISQKESYQLKDVLKGYIIGIQTTMYRKDSFKNSDRLSLIGINGDMALSYLLSKKSPIICLPDITAVYRYSGEGVFSSLAGFEKYKTGIDHFYNFHKALEFPNNKILAIVYARQMEQYTFGFIKQLKLKTVIKYIKYPLGLCQDYRMRTIFVYHYIKYIIKDIINILSAKIRL